MKDVRIELAGERLGLLAELGVDAAQSLFVQKDTGTVRLMCEPKTLPPRRPREPNDGRLIRRDAVGRRPTLLGDPLLLGFGDFDEVLPAAAAATVAAPVLNDRQLE